MKLQKSLAAILIVTALTSCGGGGSGKTTPTPSTPTVVDPGTVTTPLTTIQQDADAAQAAINISGVYPVGTTTDSTYVYIEPIEGSQNLKITAYNYIGDSYDIARGSSGANCYRIANNTDTNAIIKSPTSLTYIPAATNKEAPKFRLTVGTTNKSFEWILSRQSTQFQLTGISEGTNTTQRVTGQIEGNNYAFGVQKDASLTHENIQSKLCAGDDLKAPVSNNGTTMPILKNFAGLYDVTVSETSFGQLKTFEAYLHIDEDGTINTYHYAGDGFNQGTDAAINKGNCYEKSLAYNRSLNGTKIKYDAANNYLFAYGGNDSKLFWILDSDAKITTVGIATNNLNAMSPAITGTHVTEEGLLSISSKKAQSLTVETIVNQICK